MQTSSADGIIGGKVQPEPTVAVAVVSLSGFRDWLDAQIKTALRLSFLQSRSNVHRFVKTVVERRFNYCICQETWTAQTREALSRGRWQWCKGGDRRGIRRGQQRPPSLSPRRRPSLSSGERCPLSCSWREPQFDIAGHVVDWSPVTWSIDRWSRGWLIEPKWRRPIYFGRWSPIGNRSICRNCR